MTLDLTHVKQNKALKINKHNNIPEITKNTAVRNGIRKDRE